MTPVVALIGAGGKMGMRITGKLADRNDYVTRYCEVAEAGIARLREVGQEVTPATVAVPAADLVILAVPDRMARTVSAELVPLARPGATFLLLDPAAAMAREIALRPELHYVVSHPCHPPLFGDQPSDEARHDLFGGVAAWQDIVVALLQGNEEAYARAEALCRVIFHPVRTAHRITVEQMAILEPAMAEVIGASAAVIIHEAMEEAVRRGVPRPAAESFMLGHAQVPLAILFGVIQAKFSDAAEIAIRWGTERLIRPDWKKVFEPDQVQAAIHAMLHPEEKR